MKNTLLIIPALVIAITAITLPKPESTFSIESLSLTKENKSFANPVYADGSFIGMDGNAYYSIGQNNYQSSNGDFHYNYGQDTYVNHSNGDYTYNGLGGTNGVGGHTNNGNLSFSSLKRSVKDLNGLPQPRLAFALK